MQFQAGLGVAPGSHASLHHVVDERKPRNFNDPWGTHVLMIVDASS